MDNSYHGSVPEVWAGPECSIVRIGDHYRDQLVETGHYKRTSDIDRLAALNIRKVRYPVLWESHQPGAGGEVDWTFTAGRLEQFKQHNIEVIVGLLHHGSGPRFTSLDDERFPELFAGYAREVAARFPTINYYTPINEPLTTARFSGLYGFWYPHHQSELSFFRMLMYQLKATVLAMEEIRKVNPLAQLVQTEDLGEIQASESLQYQANFENERKWLTYDFLCGKVRPGHFFWSYLLQLGIAEEQLVFFTDHPCPPDIMGFNYYITSERYLDENIENYPEEKRGGNGIHRYADTELVRTGQLKGLYSLLKQAYNRYALPLAITECHLNCTREEQLRWVKYCWQAAMQLRQEGIPVKAFTVWSVFGSCDWDSLLTQTNYSYESGCYDAGEAVTRATAVAELVRGLFRNEITDHPVLDGAGWWEKDVVNLNANPAAKPLLIVGSESSIAKAVIRICRQRSLYHCIIHDADIDNPNDSMRLIECMSAWAVIDTRCQGHMINNETYTGNLAEGEHTFREFCKNRELPLLTFSPGENGRMEEIESNNSADPSSGEPDFGVDVILNAHLVKPRQWQHLIIRITTNKRGVEKLHTAFHRNKAGGINRFIAGGYAEKPMTAYLNIVNKGLDLFIDGENGVWDIVYDERKKAMARPAGSKMHSNGRWVYEKDAGAKRVSDAVKLGKKGNGKELKNFHTVAE